MKKIISKIPHDSFFRSSMSRPRVAREFFESHLPDYILEAVNLDTLQLRQGSFVDEELRQLVTDVLYSVELQGKPAYFYTLVEHQRKPDVWMPFRKLKYMASIMEQHRKEHNKLPIVYVMVLYNGEKKYNCSTDIFDLFGEHKALAKKIFLQPFHLVDLSQIPDEKLKQKTWSGILEMCMKHIFSRDVLPILRSLENALKEVEQSGEQDYLKIMFRYLFSRNNVKNIPALRDFIHEHLSPETEKNIMTYEEYCIAEGHQRGRQEGRQELLEELVRKNILSAEDLAKIDTLSPETHQRVCKREEDVTDL